MASILYCSNGAAASLCPLQFLPFFTPITSSLCKIPESESFHNSIHKPHLSSCFITRNGGTTSNNKQIPKIPSSRGSNSYPEPETSESQCPVPGEQLPINEYRSLSASFPFSWAAGDSAHHLPSRLLTTAVSFALFVGLPVASCSPTSAHFELARRLLGAVSSGVFAATLVAVRMYLGWAYVGNRLFSATVPYEETGWYDGQVWVKTAEVLARDRLLGTFSVKPVLSRLKFTLVVLASILLASVLLLINLEGNEKDLYISQQHRSRVIAGVYSEQSARLFEPDAYCGEPDLP